MQYVLRLFSLFLNILYWLFGQFSVPYKICLPLKRLAWLEERLGKLVTDDPSIVEASLSQYADLVYPDRSGVLHK
jgi:hypothetical protein